MKTAQLSRTIKIFLLGFLYCAVLLGVQGGYAAVPIPQVIGPIPVTPTSHPFNAADHNNTPLDLSEFGYVEEEYFVSGYANVYDLADTGVREMVVVQTPDAPYTTRILVRRPVKPEAFSGTVIVELLNPTAGFDNDIQWRFSHDYFLSHGDAWVGITSKPVAVNALKNFDPQRYAPLSWDNPLPPWQTCTDPYIPFYAPPGDTTPATENGLIWDIVSQVGALLKAPPLLRRNHPLRGFQVERVLATGYSQAGFFLVTYINFIRPLARAHLDNGTPVYDGYLIGDGDPWPPPLNQCGDPFLTGDPRTIIRPRPEPVISVITQTTVDGASRLTRRADSDLPSDRYRRYEVPGASHLSQRQMDFSPSPEDRKKTGVLPAKRNCEEIATYGLSDFPLEYIMNGAFANLDAWVRDPQGYTPPRADWITMFPLADDDTQYGIAIDQYGNARDGVRTPYLDVPIATYYGHSTAADDASEGMCYLMGYKAPFDASLVKELYCSCFVGFCLSCNRYVPQVRDRVEELVRERFITADDGERIINEAETTQSQFPYARLQPIPAPAPVPGP